MQTVVKETSPAISNPFAYRNVRSVLVRAYTCVRMCVCVVGVCPNIHTYGTKFQYYVLCAWVWCRCGWVCAVRVCLWCEYGYSCSSPSSVESTLQITEKLGLSSGTTCQQDVLHSVSTHHIHTHCTPTHTHTCIHARAHTHARTHMHQHTPSTQHTHKQNKTTQIQGNVQSEIKKFLRMNGFT